MMHGVATWLSCSYKDIIMFNTRLISIKFYYNSDVKAYEI